MRFAIYGRKSIYSDKSDSVDNQQKMCKDYIDFHFKDYDKTFEIYSDEGFSGGNMNRPALKRLLADVKDGTVDAIIVYQLDRISRNVRDFSNIYALFEEKNVMFISIKENIDTATPIGRAMMYVTMVFAQVERENISSRVADNLIGLAKKGLWTGGNPPYGYVRERIQINGKTHVSIAIDPEAAKYDEWIFDTFLGNNYSLQRMETAFKNQGIRTPNGAYFSTGQLHKILTMPYCVEATPEVYDYFNNLGCQMDSGSPREIWDGTHGVMVYGRSTEKNKKHTLQPPDKWIVCIGVHKPFIPAAKWLAAQERFKQNIFNKTMKYDIPLLKGVLRCANCGRLMAVSRKKTKTGVTSHYYCTKRMREGAEACNAKWTNCNIINNKVMEIFKKIEADPEVVQNYTADTNPINYIKKIKDLEKKAMQLRTKIERLTESITETENSSAAKYIIAQIEKEDLNLSAVKREIEEAKIESRKQQSEKQSTEKTAFEIANLIRGLDGLSSSEKNRIVREVVKECTWDGNTLFLML
ncbi:MAG: recombinase family protein [Lachnospiraceae bacterium]